MKRGRMFVITSVAELLQDEFMPRFMRLRERAELLSQEIPLMKLLDAARTIQTTSSPEIVSGEDALEAAYTQLKEAG